MNIFEALTLAKEEGERVRPICWADSDWVEFNPPTGVFCNVHIFEGRREGLRQPLRIDSIAELLGEWEVVAPWGDAPPPAAGLLI